MKIPKQINVKTALIFVVIGILMTSGLFYVFAATPSSTFYISSGVYPGAPSYTVWREGSNYFAKDANGLIAYSGTNATEITENCLSNNVHIYFAEGLFSFTHSILIPYTNVRIEGAGTGVTTLELETGSECDLMIVGIVGNTKMDFTLMNIRLNGSQSDSVGNCLVLRSMYRVTLLNAEIFHGARDGIYTTGSVGYSCYDMEFINCKISYNDRNGINATWASDSWIQNCIIGYNGRVAGTAGILFSSTAWGYISDSHIWGNYDGLYGSGAPTNTITDCYFEDNLRDGIRFYNSNNVSMQGNRFVWNGENGVSLLNPCIIQYDWHNNLAYENNGSDFSFQTGVKFYSYHGKTASIANNDWIMHNVLTTPTTILITGSTSSTIWVADRNSTYFQVGVSSGTVTVDWFAIYNS